MRTMPILLLIIATTAVRLAFAASTGLGVDESYMIAAGRHWSLGYFDHPPAAWWFSHGAAVLFGSEAPLVVRLPFILLFALSQLLVWRLGKRLGGPQAGFWAVVVLNLSPVLGVTTGTWVLPDGPLDAFLLAAVLFLMNALETGRTGWWAACGIVAGAALLSKYSAVLLMGGALLHLLTSTRGRAALRRPGPYLAAGLAVVVFSPVLIWNATHGWASFAFQGDRALGLRLHPLAPFATLGGEALFILPWIWAPLMLLMVQVLARKARWQARLLGWLALPPIAGFALVSLWSSQRVLFHWAAPGYLMLFPLLGEAIAARIDRVWLRWTLGGTAALMLLVLAAIAAQESHDFLGSSLARVMHKDPTGEGLDWTSVRTDLAERGLLPEGRPVAALNWRDAGKFGYALGPDHPMLCLSLDAREFNFADPIADYAGQDVIVLALGDPGRAAPAIRSRFEAAEMLPPATVRIGGRVLAPVTVMMGHGLKP